MRCALFNRLDLARTRKESHSATPAPFRRREPSVKEQTMKLVVAIIKPHRLDSVRDAVGANR